MRAGAFTGKDKIIERSAAAGLRCLLANHENIRTEILVPADPARPIAVYSAVHPDYRAQFTKLPEKLLTAMTDAIEGKPENVNDILRAAVKEIISKYAPQSADAVEQRPAENGTIISFGPNRTHDVDSDVLRLAAYGGTLHV